MIRRSLAVMALACCLGSAPAQDVTVSAAVDTFMGSADQAAMLTNLGGTTAGANLFKLTNPSAIRFLRVNADNTVDALSAGDMLTALGTTAYAPAAVAITGGSAYLTASDTGGATFRIPHGTAPTTPTDGDIWTTTAGMHVRINGATVDLGAGGGGLTNWTDDINTASPNASKPVATFAATNAATHVDAAVLPKGQGAFLLAVPDGTTTGGNKRGLWAVDLQIAGWSAATQVASGSRSFAAGYRATASAVSSAAVGGESNTASGSNSIVAGGSFNTASTGANPAVLGGTSNTASGNWSVIVGGSSNAASGERAAVVGGRGGQASAAYSAVIAGDGAVASSSFSVASGYQATTRAITGARAHSGGNFTNQVGQVQRAHYMLFRETANDTQTELSADGGAPGTGDRIVLPNNHVYKFRGQAVAREAATGDVKSWDITGTIERGANAAATAIVGTVTVTVKDEDAGATAWSLAVDADTTNGSLRVQGTGEASHTIRWVIEIETIELG